MFKIFESNSNLERCENPTPSDDVASSFSPSTHDTCRCRIVGIVRSTIAEVEISWYPRLFSSQTPLWPPISCRVPLSVGLQHLCCLHNICSPILPVRTKKLGLRGYLLRPTSLYCCACAMSWKLRYFPGGVSRASPWVCPTLELHNAGTRWRCDDCLPRAFRK